MDGRKRNESVYYVWTRKLLNPQQNVCGYKRIRIRVDRALVVCISCSVIIVIKMFTFETTRLPIQGNVSVMETWLLFSVLTWEITYFIYTVSPGPC